MKHLPEKSTLEIFRDCMKLASYMGDTVQNFHFLRIITLQPKTPKIRNIRMLIKAEFRKNQHVSSQAEIDKLRFK